MSNALLRLADPRTPDIAPVHAGRRGLRSYTFGRATTPIVGLVRKTSLLSGGGGFALLASLGAVGISNMVFHGIVGRRLGPADYGAVGALLSLVLVFSLPASVLQFVVTRSVATCQRRNVRFSVREAIARATALSTLIALLLGLATPWVQAFLDLESVVAVWWAVAFVVPSFVGMVARGVLIGEQRLRVVALAVLLAAVLRMALAAVFVDSSNGVATALAITTFSEVALTAFLLICCRGRLVGGGVRLSLPWSESSATVGSFAGLWILSGAGLVLSRHLLSSEAAGMYAAVTTVSQVMLFAPQAIGVIAHSRFAGADDVEARSVLRVAVIATVAVCAVLGTALVVGHTIVIDVWFGGAYAVEAGLVALMALALASIAVANLLIAFHLERTRRWTPAGWIGLGSFVGAGLLVNTGVFALATVFALAAITVVAYLARRRSPGSIRGMGPVPCTNNDRLRADPELELTVVVPFYNPGTSVVDSVRSLVEVLETSTNSFEVIAVDDGSSDGSGDLLAAARCGPAVRVVTHSCNRGKGAALRTGFGESRGRLVGFWDGDGDIDPSSWPTFIDLMSRYDADAVVGSKRHPGSGVVVSPTRRMVSRGYQILVRLLFGLRVADTQVGIKLFRRRVLADVLPLTAESGFALDLELLALARCHGLHRVIEAPVRLCRAGGSTIAPRTVVRMFTHTVGVRRHVRRQPLFAPSGPRDDRGEMVLTGTGWV